MQLHQDSKPAKSAQGEKRQRTKQTLWGMDAEQEPIGIYPRRVCVGFAFSAASEARSEQISSFYIKTSYLTGISLCWRVFFFMGFGFFSG